ncbi:MAG: hypothetical protein P8Y36_04525, partial [Alphaproteobacteria bacterium]
MSDTTATTTATKAVPAPGKKVIRAERISFARLLIRAIGISFASIISLLLAFYAFYAMPQVQDLLFDAKPYLAQEIIYWAGFYIVGIFLWALPLVFTARLLLMQNFDEIGVDSEDRFRFIIFRLPSLYVVFAFLAVLIGILTAASNLPTPSPLHLGNPAEGPLRDYIEQHLITLFFVTLVVLVLVIIRNFFILGYGKQMQGLETKNPAAFKKTLIRFEKLANKVHADLDAMDLHLTQLKPDFLSMETWIAAQRVKVFMWRYMSWVWWIILALIALHFISYSEHVQGLFAATGVPSSDWFSSTMNLISDTLSMKRAVFLHVLFGAWLPFIAFLALLSNRYQFPFIATIIVVAIGLTLFISDGHDMRVIPLDAKQQAKLNPPSFQDAVSKWKAASGWNDRGCEQIPAEDPRLKDCPRPIIVAGEGGGSRAAFLTASVLGSLEDQSLDQVRDDSTARPFHRQLFAISSVSGSSVGAAFYIGALQRQSWVPLEKLKKALYRQRLWFLNVANAGKDNEKFLHDAVTYKDALQATLSNDFLSPVMMGYLARDVPTLSRFPMVLDRAGVIETAWEDAFADVYGLSRQKSPLSAPLQTFIAGETPDKWMPLLFFNSTSIETGRRILITPTKINAPLKDGSVLFADTYDLHELVCSNKNVANLRLADKIARFLPSIFSPLSGVECKDGKPITADIRLSTAVSLSSRSPFVSPHANIRDKNAQVVDSAVDGAYFDNSGAITAIEIARGLKVTDERLLPFVVQISNEPEWFPERCENGRRQSVLRPPLQDEADLKSLGTFGNIFTVNATRIARSYETIIEMPRQISAMNNGVISGKQIYICPQRKENFFWGKIVSASTPDMRVRSLQMQRNIQVTTKEHSAQGRKSVSLSWWLSPPLQAYLDAQVYSRHNKRTRNCVLSLLRSNTAGQYFGRRDPCGFKARPHISRRRR